MAVDVLEALRTARGWVNYGPGPPFDFLAGAHPATEEQLAAELGRLHAAGFRGLVTNTVAFGLERAPQIAKDCGFEHVVAKLWWQNDELLATEKANLDAAVDAVDAVCVGNEIIQKGIADHDRLVREVDEARERFGRPVTTGFQPPDWQFFPDLQETSFPSGAVPPEAAPGATPENQKRFYEALLATGVPFVWFLAVDSPLHRTASPPGGFGGLWDENWQPKPVVELLASAL